MTRNLLFTYLFITYSFCSFGQSNDTKAIQQILNDITAAQTKGDVAALDSIYSSDFIFISSNGVKFNKTERLDYLKNNIPESFAFENDKIRIYGNTVVVNTEVKIKLKGGDLQTNLATIVMVKMHGQWKEVSAQGTSMGTK
jgi:ketosteroid isomerase-like protein